VVAQPAAHVERPHAVGAHIAEGHRRPGLGSWSCGHAGEDTRSWVRVLSTSLTDHMPKLASDYARSNDLLPVIEANNVDLLSVCADTRLRDGQRLAVRRSY
jgi:hypothetical protein